MDRRHLDDDGDRPGHRQGVGLHTTEGLDAVAAGLAEWYASHPEDIGNQTRAVLSARDTTAAGMTATATRIAARAVTDH